MAALPHNAIINLATDKILKHSHLKSRNAYDHREASSSTNISMKTCISFLTSCIYNLSLLYEDDKCSCSQVKKLKIYQHHCSEDLYCSFLGYDIMQSGRTEAVT
jgi:hypothetical protein